jgi:hypothetical protein
VDHVLTTIHDGNWGDLASVLGVLISVIGFAFTLIGLARSKSAARQASEAVADVRQKLSLQGVAVDLNTLMSDIEEIKLLHRFGAWDAMPIRYAAVRKKLFTVKGTSLTKSQKSSIQGIIEQFRAIEEIVEVALASKQSPQDIASLNKLATEQEIARNSVESWRPSTLIGYATAAPFAIGFLATALASEDNNSGIWRNPITFRNCRSATSRPEPTQRSI